MAITNEEIFPKNGIPEPPYNYIDVVVKGYGNIVEHSARNVIVSGDANYVGEATSNITILNSSGCVVSSGVIGCTIINSSGIIIESSDLLYINNKLIGSIDGGAYVKTSASTYIITLAIDTLEIRYAASLGEYYLPSPVGHYQKFTIKNMSVYDQIVGVYGFTIDDTTSGGLGQITLGTLDSITVQSDGVSNYIII